MNLRLRKSPFKRNQDREKNIGDIFNNASSSLNSVMSLTLTIFFTPALIATSLFSQEIVLMLINLSLCLGNLSNFVYRVYKKEVGTIELLVSLSMLAGVITAAYFLFPTIVSTASVLGIIALANQFAIGINLFFLFRNSIVPPIIGWFRSIGKALGFDVQDKYYQIKPLDLKEDACVVNALMQKHFGHGFKEGPIEDDLNKLNQLLNILQDYINKYDEIILGDVKYNEVIKTIEGHIRQITLKGNADSSFSFIRQKIAYKEVKVHRLQQAKSEGAAGDQNWQWLSKYCKGVDQSSYQRQPSMFNQKAIELLDKEIERQQTKIDRLSGCLP